MTTLNGFAYAELSFGADGSTTDPAQSTSAPALALGADVTDLLVLAHGWNNDPPAARNLYDGLTAAMARCGGAPAGLAVLGVLWPAKQYDAAPAVAANIAADPSGQAAEAFVQGVRAQVGADLVAAPAAPSWADPGDQQEMFFGLDPGALLERFGPVEDGVSSVLNLATYYTMKARSAAVGRGLARVLSAARAARPDLRLHLAGHSFGARVMASAVATADPLPVASATLIQGALSHYGFARRWDGVHDGMFRPALVGGRVRGPVVVTYSRHDEVLGIAYALASRLADQADSALGPIGGKHDKFGALGANGALSTPEAVWMGMMGQGGGRYAFAGGSVTNLEASAFIPSHSVIGCTEVGMAVVGAILGGGGGG
ncbi:alpha/beta hydrolase [Catenulispora yoronensis]|uniref:Alpha/beta hydrolase n=1 Tax=Catenulispora yoronensis TaxID=450799 RepID=A0ABN2UU05_9ACTN